MHLSNRQGLFSNTISGVFPIMIIPGSRCNYNLSTNSIRGCGSEHLVDEARVLAQVDKMLHAQ